MPTLNEISQKQMDAIWLSLHHSPNDEYVKKYFPLIEKAAKNGDIRLTALATIKDRILFEDGDPQIYGTQVYKGELYDLSDPEYVDQRRAEVGLQPIKEYLRQFNIPFDIPQKTK